jgi:hypothetical protein
VLESTQGAVHLFYPGPGQRGLNIMKALANVDNSASFRQYYPKGPCDANGRQEEMIVVIMVMMMVTVVVVLVGVMVVVVSTHIAVVMFVVAVSKLCS